MNNQHVPDWFATKGLWAEAVGQAVDVQANGFLRKSASISTKEAPTRNSVILRSWIYRDVHVRLKNEATSFLSYDTLPVSAALRKATVKTSGWKFEAGSIVNERRQLSLVPHSDTQEGFILNGNEVEIPRLRCGTSPGWLTVAGLNGEVPKHCYRLYLPGVGSRHLEKLINAIDSSTANLAWTLKSSVGVNRDGLEVPRADQTVIYVSAHRGIEAAEISTFLNALDENAPASTGPGFSVELRPGVYFGGQGNEHGSFGTRMAGIAADSLLRNDPSPLTHAELNLREEAIRFERGE